VLLLPAETARAVGRGVRRLEGEAAARGREVAGLGDQIMELQDRLARLEAAQGPI
jgi:hypothetical protein